MTTINDIKKLAYDLTIEHVKQTKILECGRAELPSKLEYIINTSNDIFDYLNKNKSKIKISQ